MIQTSSYFEPENRKSLNEHPIRERNGVQDVGQPLPFPGEHRERFTDHAYFKFWLDSRSLEYKEDKRAKTTRNSK